MLRMRVNLDLEVASRWGGSGVVLRSRGMRKMLRPLPRASILLISLAVVLSASHLIEALIPATSLHTHLHGATCYKCGATAAQRCLSVTGASGTSIAELYGSHADSGNESSEPPDESRRDVTPMEQYEQSLAGERKARIAFDKHKRRLLRATTDIRAYDLILEEPPLLRAPRGRHHLLPTIAEKVMEEDGGVREVILDLHDSTTQHEGEWSVKGRMQTNAHEIAGTGEAGVFPLAAMANHDCEPNAKYVTDAHGVMFLRARRHIAKAEEVTLSYIDALMPVHERRAELETGYGFRCECEKCRRELGL